MVDKGAPVKIENIRVPANFIKIRKTFKILSEPAGATQMARSIHAIKS